MTKRIWMGALLSACVALTMTAHARWATRVGAADVPGEMAANEFGVAESVHRSGLIDRSNPFFLELGVNGRTCASCHDGRAGWTITPTFARQLFNASDGLPPLFRIHDAGSRPDADISTLDARREAFATLLDRGVTRFLRTIPATADFEVIAVDDPAGFSTPAQFSNFRRPNPVANIALESSITWNGGPQVLPDGLAAFSNGATRFHAQRVANVPLDQQNAMRDFMAGLFFAQSVDAEAGRLDAAGARGGPLFLSMQEFYLGINDLQGHDPQGRPFTPKVFDIYDAWAALRGGDDVSRARAAIARGQALFNSLEFEISGVAGLNDELGQPAFRGTCSICHNAPNAGSHSVFRMMNIGTADESRKDSDLPLVTVRNKTTGEVMKVTDLGRALNTRLWQDVGKFKVPTLRGLAARAPYFHDGSARSLKEVIQFYKDRFDIELSGEQRDDLEAFLRAL
jgi:cytochrome c peroxidase